MQLEIATGFYQSDSLPLAAQRCINWDPIVPQASALNQRALFDVRGLAEQTLTGDTISGIGRGAAVLDGVPFYVNGQTLYSFTEGLVATDHGSVVGSVRVSLAVSTRYLVVLVPGQAAYVFDNEDSSLTEITDVDFQTSDTVTFKDGYFIFSTTDGEQFFISNLNQPLVYSALDFGSADVRPDKIVAVHVNHNELYVCGSETIELFQNVGGAGFPFSRVQGADIQKGVHSKYATINFDNSWVFLGGDKNELSAVWMVSGGGAQKISTSAIDNSIQKFTEDELALAYFMTWSYGGNFYMSLTMTSTVIASKTFVYNATTTAATGQLTWHERQSGIADDKWRVTEILHAYGELFAQDQEDGRVGILDKDTFEEYAEPIKRQKTSMPFDLDRFPLFVSELKLTMESGVGTIAGLDPQVRLEISDDHARTWSTQWPRSYGVIGAYQSYPSWRRQGRVPRDRVVRFTTTEPVKSVVIRLDALASMSGQQL